LSVPPAASCGGKAGGASSNDVYLPAFHAAAPDFCQVTPVRAVAGDEVSGIDVDLELRSVIVRGRIVFAPIDNSIYSHKDNG